MPGFDTYSAQTATKMLLLGDTGAGKTGSLVSLAAAGFRVHILDLDRGAEIIKDFVLNPSSPYVRESAGRWKADPKGILSRIDYVTITEQYIIQGTKPVPKGTAWQRINAQLNDWTDGERKLGNIGTWGPEDILVIDSLSRAASAAMDYQLVINGRAVSGKPEQNDWGQAQALVETLLKLLYSDDVKCNVIVCAHITPIETDLNPVAKGYPQTLGKALSPKIGQFFNHTLMIQSSGQGAGARHTIYTNTRGLVELKNPAPLRVKPEYPIETGLADYFADIRGGAYGPQPKPKEAGK